MKDAENSPASDRPLTLNEAAAHFRVSRRAFQDIIARYPFYRMMGRRKLFFPDDVARIRDALPRPKHFTSRARLTTKPEIRTSEAAWAELRALLEKPRKNR